MIHKLFLVNLKRPYKAIAEVEAEIRVSAKRTWAMVPLYGPGRVKRCLIGSSAFYTRAGAERVKLAALGKIIHSQYALRYRAPSLIAAAYAELKSYRETGVLH